jgi:hypothetical protein
MCRTRKKNAKKIEQWLLAPLLPPIDRCACLRPSVHSSPIPWVRGEHHTALYPALSSPSRPPRPLDPKPIILASSSLIHTPSPSPPSGASPSPDNPESSVSSAGAEAAAVPQPPPL